MLRRFAPLFAIVLGVAPTTDVFADAYVFKALGSPALYSVSSVDRVWYDATRGRNVPARIYYPTGSSDTKKFPVIIFSTGLGRSRDDGADHMTYSGHLRVSNGVHDAMFQRLIAECSAVFWDAYLKDDPAAKNWLAGEAMRNHLGGAARVEKKLTPTSTASR